MTQTLQSLTFKVVGLPAPQGSKRGMLISGRAIVVEGGSNVGQQKQKAWRHAVIDAATTARGDTATLDGPLAVRIEFRMPRPQARRRHLYADRKPDLDKLARNVLDALTQAGVIVDDARVCDLHVTKTYALEGDSWTGATITITPLTEAH